jgi:HK97 family phage portal protein
MANIFDRMIVSVLSRDYIKRRLVPQAMPGYMRTEVAPGEFNLDNFLADMDNEARQQLALSISWIYADISLLADKVISSELKVKKLIGEKTEDISNHPFELLMAKPNEFMSRSFLIRHLITSLMLSKNGAFVYLSPQRGTKNIIELWPINPGRVTPIIDKLNYLKHFRYQPSRSGNRAYKINPEYVVWFRYADIFDYWASAPPLIAMLDTMSIELGIASSQKKFYTEGRGIPLSVVSVSPDMSEPDFAQFRQDLKDDWEREGTTLAIARGGTLDVESLGFTQKDLEILGNQELSRDKIDSVLLKIPFRDLQSQGGESLKQADRFINDNVIHPLQKLIAEQITLQALMRFWGDDLRAEFEDVRAQDRSLTIQENNVYSRWMTMDEMRQTQGNAPLSGDIGKLIGELPVPLATNASFVGNLLQLNVDPTHIADPDEPGNLAESQDSLAVVNQLADGDTTPDEMIENIKSEAIHAELKRWKRVARKSFSNNGDPLSRTFESTIIPANIRDNITLSLMESGSLDDISDVFNPFIVNHAS